MLHTPIRPASTGTRLLESGAAIPVLTGVMNLTSHTQNPIHRSPPTSAHPPPLQPTSSSKSFQKGSDHMSMCRDDSMCQYGTNVSPPPQPNKQEHGRSRPRALKVYRYTKVNKTTHQKHSSRPRAVPIVLQKEPQISRYLIPTCQIADRNCCVELPEWVAGGSDKPQLLSRS